MSDNHSPVAANDAVMLEDLRATLRDQRGRNRQPLDAAAIDSLDRPDTFTGDQSLTLGDRITNNTYHTQAEAAAPAGPRLLAGFSRLILGALTGAAMMLATVAFAISQRPETPPPPPPPDAGQHTVDHVLDWKIVIPPATNP